MRPAQPAIPNPGNARQKRRLDSLFYTFCPPSIPLRGEIRQTERKIRPFEQF